TRRWNGAWSTGSSRRLHFTKRRRSWQGRSPTSLQRPPPQASAPSINRWTSASPKPTTSRARSSRQASPTPKVARAWTPSSTSARRQSIEWLYHPPLSEGRLADETILETRGLTKEFKGFVAVKDVSLKVRRGSIHALIGPNGAGKTTCFNLLTHFLEPTRGQIFFKGREI